MKEFLDYSIVENYLTFIATATASDLKDSSMFKISETIWSAIINSAAVIAGSLLSFWLAQRMVRYSIQWKTKDLYDINGEMYTSLFVVIQNNKSKPLKLFLKVRDFSMFKHVTNTDVVFGPAIEYSITNSIVEIPNNGVREIEVGRVIDEVSSRIMELPLVLDELTATITKPTRKQKRQPYLRSKSSRKSQSSIIRTDEVLSSARKRNSNKSSIDPISHLLGDDKYEKLLWESYFRKEITSNLTAPRTNIIYPEELIKSLHYAFAFTKDLHREKRRTLLIYLESLGENLTREIVDFCVSFAEDSIDNLGLKDLYMFIAYDSDRIETLVKNYNFEKNFEITLKNYVLDNITSRWCGPFDYKKHPISSMKGYLKIRRKATQSRLTYE